MTKSTNDPIDGHPIFLDTAAPDIKVDPTEAAAYAGKVGTRLIGTSTERAAYPYARQGLRWYDTTAGGEMRFESGNWVPSETPRPLIVSRTMSAVNTFVNKTAFDDFPVSADATALASTLVKRFAATKLIVRIYASAQLSSGAAQGATLGLRIGSTDYVVVRRMFSTAPDRESLVNSIALTDVPAGSHAVKPRFRADTASQFEFFADDFLTYEILETM